MLSKLVYAAQPYEVGPKNRKSLAIVIPARLAREYGINTSSIFKITGNKEQNKVIIQTMEPDGKNEFKVMSSGGKFRVSDQQTSPGV